MPTISLVDNQGVEYKAISGQINVDDAKGIVECFVSGIGNKDSVGDIVLPGAFTESLKRRKPRVVWGHDWNHPIGKVLEIYEVPASDPRLPAKMRQAGIGGLFAKVQFNLKSEKGREAFANVAFYGMDQEWCVDTETEILTDRGWLKYNEVSTDDRAYVLDPELGWGKFEQIQAVNIWPAQERRMRLIETGGHSSLTTAAHRWPLASNTNGGNVTWATTETLRPQDRMIRSAARSDAPVVQKYTDAFVELVGWFWTEGWVPPADHTDAGLYLAQSTRVNPQHVASIRAALQAEFPGQWSERHSSDNMARFRLPREAAEAIKSVTGQDKEPTADFLTNLTRSQLLLLIQTCMNGDGRAAKSGQSTWYQVSENGVRAFEMLCALSGQPTNTTNQKDYGKRYGQPPLRVSLLRTGVAKPLDAIRVKAYGYKNGEPRTPAVDEWIDTTGEIWCPTTPSGTWLARRNGSVYFTGNSIGYKTLDAIYDNQRQANLLREVELYEVSPVLHGANQLTGTISIKADAVNLEEEFDMTNLSFEENQFVKYLDSLSDEEFEKEFPESGMYSKVVFDVTGAFVRRAATNRRRRRRRRKDASSESQVDSFRKSKWEMFDREFAARIKKEYPEIWAAGGNIKGNDQYRILTKIAEQGGVAKTPDQVAALELREAWVARHAQDFRLAGVIAQIKWLAIGSRGEDYMKNVVREAIDKKNQKSSESDEKGQLMMPGYQHGGKPGMMGMLTSALEARAGGNVRIQELSKNTVIFDVMKGDEVMTLRVPFYFGDGQFMFGEPEPVKRVVSWVEAEDGDDEDEDKKRYMLRHKLNMDDAFDENLAEDFDEAVDDSKQCGCGCKGRCGSNPASFVDDLFGLMKNADDGQEVKAGRVISAGNLEKLQAAIDILKEIVAAGGRAEIELKDEETVFVGTSTERLFALKSFIDPVIDFHNAEFKLTENGITLKSNSNDFLTALNNAVKNFNHLSTKSL
jgi:HK97 family phage prohead protease